MFLLAGTFFPIDEFPHWAIVASQFNPLYHCVELVRHAAFGFETADIGHVAALVIFAGADVAARDVADAQAAHRLMRRARRPRRHRSRSRRRAAAHPGFVDIKQTTRSARRSSNVTDRRRSSSGAGTGRTSTTRSRRTPARSTPTPGARASRCCTRQGDTFAFFFRSPGTYAYHCKVHPDMTGQVVVETRRRIATSAAPRCRGHARGSTAGEAVVRFRIDERASILAEVRRPGAAEGAAGRVPLRSRRERAAFGVKVPRGRSVVRLRATRRRRQRLASAVCFRTPLRRIVEGVAPPIFDVEQAVLLLELDPPFGKREVQLARRKLAKVWHPDIAPPGQQFEHERHLKVINEAADTLEQPGRGRRAAARSPATPSRSAPPPRARRARRPAGAPTRRSSASAATAADQQQHDPFGSRMPDHSVVHRYARCLSYPEWGVGTVQGIYFTGDGDHDAAVGARLLPHRHPHRAGRLAALRRLLQARPGADRVAALHAGGQARAGRGGLQARRQAARLRARRRARATPPSCA